MLTHPWAGVGLLAASLLGTLVAVRAIRARYGLHPEVSRKILHVGLGLAMLVCPTLFHTTWPVVVLAAATMLVLGALRWVPVAAEHFGGVVGGVSRPSAGDFYFPVAAALLFAVTRGDPILYGIPILTLTLADAAAALVGVFYGRTRYAVADGAKSLEGSLAFAIVAWLVVFVPLRLAGHGADAAALVGVIVAVVLTAVEAVSPHGSDNLFIPLGGALLLRLLLPLGAPSLRGLLLALAVIAVLSPSLRPRRRVRHTGARPDWVGASRRP